MRDLSSLSLHDETGHLLLLSDESNMLVEYDEDSHPRSLLGLWRGMHGLEHTVPQAEGLAMDEQHDCIWSASRTCSIALCRSRTAQRFSCAR
ncbi:SdiA-regulated domain-containing protein [Halopseudomonas pachastrellae]|nr:SdiA-regulated domain-containing protein [Halopseudomonas pachastrellae]